ncbi:DUF1573 domain-containing protein [uncultured Draconibacterium sp.]|uniref:DUF1573 domain-containing protein n=1 Tax=uncultured Draconibacterium sp. TaxID=1573823 RepID=UPI00325FEB0C
MYKFVVIAVLMLFVSCGAEKQKDSAKKVSNTNNLTEISIEKPLHDFGQLKAGEIVLHTFILHNNGQNNFILAELVSDCGCITAQAKQQVIKPGANTIIEVEFNTAGLAGKEYKTIEVHGNSKELKHLAIFAEVKNEFIDIKY